MIWLLGILQKIKFVHVLLICVIGLLFVSSTLYDKVEKTEKERDRHHYNYEQLVEKDSTKVANLTLKYDKELEHYLNVNTALREVIEKKDIKIKDIQSITHQVHKYVDTVKSVHSIVRSVVPLDTAEVTIVPFVDKTDCMTIEGNVTYTNDTILLNINKREYNSNLSIISHWKRNQRNMFTRWFGKKEVEVTASSTCGGSKTVTIKRS